MYDMTGPLQRSYAVAREFFACPDKARYRMGQHTDVGYVNMPHVKEFYQVGPGPDQKCSSPPRRTPLMMRCARTCCLLADAVHQEEQRNVAYAAGQLQGSGARIL